MNHWQLFIVFSSLTYMTIACGAYGYLIWKAMPMLPYAGAIPAFRGLKDPEKFLKLVALVVSFGWPVLLVNYGYMTLIEKMGKLAGINWKDLIDVEVMKQMSESPAKAMNLGIENGAAIALAAHLEEICIEIVLRSPKGKQSKVQAFVFESPEKIARLLSDRESIGEVLQSFLRDAIFGVIDEKQGERMGEIDAEFESADDALPPPAPFVARTPFIVIPMTKVPNEEEIAKIDHVGLAKIIYAIAADRATACRALFDLEDQIRFSFTSRSNKDEPTMTYTPGIQQECKRANAIIDSWMDLVR